MASIGGRVVALRYPVGVGFSESKIRRSSFVKAGAIGLRLTHCPAEVPESSITKFRGDRTPLCRGGAAQPPNPTLSGGTLPFQNQKVSQSPCQRVGGRPCRLHRTCKIESGDEVKGEDSLLHGRLLLPGMDMQKAKRTTLGIPTWSPTVVLIQRLRAYIWQSGRDA